VKIQTEIWDNGRLTVNSAFARLLRHNDITTAQALWTVKSQGVKETVPDRGTGKVLLEPMEGEGLVETYIKRYQPWTFRNTFKALLSFKKPRVFDGLHEWQAILAFHERELPTMTPIAAARHGRHTCNLTLGITDYTRASELVRQDDLSISRRHKLVSQIGTIAGRMHRYGFAHQDFYLVHVFIQEEQDDRIFIIDLQRLIMEKRLPDRWRIKDLAQLLFSAYSHVGKLDIARFITAYNRAYGKDLREKGMLDVIEQKALRIERHHRRRYMNLT